MGLLLRKERKMKYRNKIKRLEARKKAWESLPKSPDGAFTKPGSFKKN
jgi:hypothetical protein